MSTTDFGRLRQEYEAEGLSEASMPDDPIEQFRSWFEAAVAAGVDEPNAFVLATVDNDGSPSARAVLMKEYDDSGIVFYTGLESRKSLAMRSNGRAAATFVWIPLHRQVRFEGSASEVPADRADEYFATRPRGAQIAAHASLQSTITTRESLDAQFEELGIEFEDEEVPRPQHWGGWLLKPFSVEFWQGQPNRFHDRVRYRIEDGHWVKERLAP